MQNRAYGQEEILLKDRDRCLDELYHSKLSQKPQVFGYNIFCKSVRSGYMIYHLIASWYKIRKLRLEFNIGSYSFYSIHKVHYTTLSITLLGFCNVRLSSKGLTRFVLMFEWLQLYLIEGASDREGIYQLLSGGPARLAFWQGQLHKIKLNGFHVKNRRLLVNLTRCNNR